MDAAAADLGLLILRVWTGAVMIAHGVNHARTPDRTARWFKGLGWRAPRYQALLSAWGEITVGAGLTLGLLTSPAAAGVTAMMLAAYLTLHRRNGFFIFNQGQGYEYAATLALAGAALALLGGGGWSLDRAIGADLPPAWRIWIMAAGFALGAAHTAAWWRPNRTGG